MASSKSALLAQTLADLTLFFQANQANTYLLASSGGLDSMVLCTLLIELQLPIQILHVNYGLRTTESDADEAFVRAFCKKYHIELHALCIDLQSKLSQNKGNLQAEARKIRYDFFKEIQIKNPKSLICTAHHADDQIETFWLQLSRSAGLKGLAGMARADQRLLRPLLILKRVEILALAKELKVNWREDKSNASLKYRRNFWRHTFLPFLRSKIPTLNQAIQVIQSNFSNEIAAQEQVLKLAQQQFENYQSIDLIELSKLTAYQFIELFKSQGFPMHIIKRSPDLFRAENGKYISWKNPSTQSKCYLVRQQKQIALFTEVPTEWAYLLKTPSTDQTSQPLPFHIDTSQIKGEPFFRSVQNGDTILVRGMKGSKKVLRVLKEAGIPAPLRMQQMILCDQEKVLAIPQLAVNAAILAKAGAQLQASLCFYKKP